MRKTISALALSAILAGSGAWAQSERPMTTRGEAEEITKGALKDEVVSVKPQLGVVAYRDLQDETTARAAGGIGIDWNVAGMFLPEDMKQWYLGLSSGAIYSHLGSADSNFLGTSPEVGIGASGANFLQIPANLKVGYNVSENTRVSAHGGGNVIYRSVGTSMSLGPSTATDSQIWRIYPNAGVDFEVGFGNAMFIARPDFTFTPGNDIFTGTLGVGIALG